MYSTVSLQVDEFRRLTMSPTILQQQLGLRPVDNSTRSRPKQEDYRGFVDELYEFPMPPSPSDAHIIKIAFADGEPAEGSTAPSYAPSSSGKKAQEEVSSSKTLGLAAAAAASRGGRRSFEDRFGDLPMPIRWRLIEACKAEMEELLENVEKEMMNAGTTLPEDVSMWRDVIAAADVVGLDVEKPKRKLLAHSNIYLL